MTISIKYKVVNLVYKYCFQINTTTPTFATPMKRFLFTALFVLIVTHADAQKRVFFVKLQEKNGVYYYEGKPFTGLSLERDDSTKRKKIELNWKDGVLHGPKTTWFQNEKVRQIMHFHMGQRHGEFMTHHENGQLKEKGNYHFDTLHGTSEGFYKNGRKQFVFNYNKGVRDGLNEMFFDNGKPEQKVTFVNGKIHGAFTSWYPEGHLMKEIYYNMGVLHGSYKTWHMDGSRAEEGQYQNGKKHGKYIFYEIFVDVPVTIEHYDNGIKDGVWISMGIEGDTMTFETWSKGELNGLYFDTHKGKLNNHGHYKKGKKHGYWKQDFSLKIAMQEGRYEDGYRIGDWILYNELGNWLVTVTFDENQEIVAEKWAPSPKSKPPKKSTP
jgi:antitoxin component YwqK of YwqJK toxin-antitoxin module